MQEWFMACVNSVKAEIERKQAVPLGFRGKLQMPEIEKFGLGERRKVLDKLLANENVLLFLYEKLFPTETDLKSPQKLVKQSKGFDLKVPEMPTVKNLKNAGKPIQKHRP